MYSTTRGARSRHASIPLLARTVRGLEWVAAAEIKNKLGPVDCAIAHREVRFGVESVSRDLLELSTVDDVFVVVYDGAPVGHTRLDLARLGEAISRANVRERVSMLGSVRPLSIESVDVSASFLGRRNYSRFDIEDVIGKTLESGLGWRYESRRAMRPDSGDVSVRVHLTRDRSTVGIRVGAQPLHRRRYRASSRPGALHPPVARALALLAGLEPGLSLLDPFCGTGTVAIEAGLACPSLTVAGSDIDRNAVEATLTNAARARADVDVRVADAARLPHDDASIDRIATNLPWGKAAQPGGLIASSLKPVWKEFGRVLTQDGRIALLARQGVLEEVPRGGEFVVVLRNPVRISGAWAEILVLDRPGGDAQPLDTHGLLGRELEMAARLRDQWMSGLLEASVGV